MFYLSSLCRTLFCHCPIFFFFFFQAEDGIRDWSVTGVQTCALPISLFSITSALFDKNTGGRVSRSGLWTLGGSRRRLPVPETKLRDTRGWHTFDTLNPRGGVGPRDLLLSCEKQNGKAAPPAPCPLWGLVTLFYFFGLL